MAEAAIVSTLLARGVSHAQVRRAIAHLPGRWPLSDARLATTAGARPRIVLRDDEGDYALSPRGWQLMVAPPQLNEVRLRLRHGG